MKSTTVFRTLGLTLGWLTLLSLTHPMGAVDTAATPSVSGETHASVSEPGEGHSLDIQGEFVTAIQILPPLPSFN